SADADPVTIYVAAPPSISQSPQSEVIAAGSTALFSVLAEGSNPLFYQWRLGGTPLSGKTNAVLVLNAVQLSDAGAYSVIVANAVGATTSGEAVLTVLVPQVVPGNNFSERVAISGTNGFAGGTNTFATREDGEPYHAQRQGSNSVWYTWHAPATGIATFRTS